MKSSPESKKGKKASALGVKGKHPKKASPSEGAKKEKPLKETTDGNEKESGKTTPGGGAGKYMDEEEMLDVAEHCFIRMAESLIERGRTARSIFSKYSVPEQFPDGTVLELLSPIGFLEGVKEACG